MKFFVINLALSGQHAWKPGPSFNPWQPHCSWPGGWNDCCSMKYLDFCIKKKIKWWYSSTGCCSSSVCRWNQRFLEVFSMSLLENNFKRNKLFIDICLWAVAIFSNFPSSDCPGWEAGYNGTSFHGMKLAGILVSSSAENHYYDWGSESEMIWNKFNTFGIRGCFPHHQHQVICFGFLLVLTPANWEELLRRLVRYLTEKPNWTIFKRLLWAMHRRMKQCSVSFVSQVVRREKRSGSTYFAMFKSSWWAVLCEMSLVQFWFWDLAWFELFLLNLRD